MRMTLAVKLVVLVNPQATIPFSEAGQAVGVHGVSPSMCSRYTVRPLVLVGLLVVAACAPSGVAPTTPEPTTTVPGLAVPTAREPGEQPSETGPIRAASSVVSPDDLPDWPASYEGPRSGPFYPYGVEHVEYQVACLTDLGFSVWSTADGRGISVAEGTPFALIDPARRACSPKAFEIGLVARDRFDEPDYRAPPLSTCSPLDW